MTRQTQVHASSRSIEWPKTGTRPAYTSEIFGSQVFSLQTLQKTLPKPVFSRFVQQIKGRQSLDKSTADAVAHAVRIWAMDR